jgi:hypothetical protein
MRHLLPLSALLLTIVLGPLSGCFRKASTEPAAPPIVWAEEGWEHEGVNIRLGFRGQTSSAASTVEPVASLTRAGEPLAGAMVFIALVPPHDSAEDSGAHASDLPTLYVPLGKNSPALYTAGKLPVPPGATAVRFRIVLPDAKADVTREVPLP